MKNKFYSKYQIYAITGLFVGIMYMIFNFFQYEKSIKNGVLVEKVVISQSCRSYTKLASGISIKEGNEVYSVKLDYGTCIKYPVKSKIKVVHDKNRALFIYPVKILNYGKIYLLGILLLISLIPWLYLIKLVRNTKKPQSRRRSRRRY
ncbi:hypothetical protein SGQ83_09055 [Flavobacterium sp. Fl-318]|uniref:DUF3592 domain-containing protein n=1 Tax=Flavobacterium cupriresistens TaxID=2893885 RepID=A0ABU4RAA7_9FLAO|nr:MULTISPECIES: hypothetical protein [unclassified Flavobacterium]MDX6189494.1 hypothetical protein [Flavobacterium sp. Fl-318]UFH41097.1 hypothetical protein LNP23_14900 [Flavobacterium sp. F-323]